MKDVRLNNGVMMPAVGFGVYQIPVDETEEIVNKALEVGYRMFDTASAYFNEEQVGKAIASSAIKREELFITTKLWVQDYEYEDALKAFDLSLHKLGLDYIDLYLLHKPYGNYYAAWRALEKLYKMEYLTPGNPAVMRMIGWCQLETGDSSAALDYYTRLFAATGHPSADDHANFAHALWINGRGREALEHYTAAANARGTDWLAKTLGDDARILGRAGIGPTERDIMADMVRSATDKD